MSSRYGLLLFDLDGTLVDSLADIAGALNHVLTTAGGAAIEPEVVRTMVGEGVERLVEKALARQPRPLGVGAAVLAGEMRARYRAKPCVLSRLFPGVRELVDALRARAGLRLVVLTNKPGDVARALLAALEAAGDFDAIVGDGDGHPRKPDPTAVHALCARFAVPAASTLMVGDGLPDLAIARAAGCASAAALWGYTPREDLIAQGPTIVLERPSDLLANI